MIQTDTLRSADVPEQDIQKLQAAWEAFQNAKNHAPHQTPHIACTGIYNAGKSTLLNALAGKEIFPTGDIPTTKKIAQAEFDGAVYIDTPGLNAAEEDDRETQAAYESADFILFVSNAQNGGISAAEAEWLQRLKSRYSSLQQRLIFVLTHCTQVDAEQLPAIQEKIREDLKKTLEFVPDQVFCVDSVTYQDGVKVKESLLVESSGIRNLQKRIAEKTAEAEKLLAQAWESELAQRQTDVQQQINKIHATVRKTQDKADRQQKRQLAMVDKAWAELEAQLKEAKPYTKIGGISCRIFPSKPSGKSKKDKSQWWARTFAESDLESFYEDSIPSAVNVAVDKSKKYAEKFCNAGLDSAYYHACEQVNQAFLQGTLALKRLGVPATDVPEIDVKPSIPDVLLESIGWILTEATRLRSVSEYVERASVWEDYETVRGLFGIEHDVTKYSYDLWSIATEMESEVNDSLRKNSERANDKLNDVWQDFRRELLSKIKKNKAILKKQVDAYKKALSKSAVPTSTQAALSFLESLMKEVSQ